MILLHYCAIRQTTLEFIDGFIANDSPVVGDDITRLRSKIAKELGKGALASEITTLSLTVVNGHYSEDDIDSPETKWQCFAEEFDATLRAGVKHGNNPDVVREYHKMFRDTLARYGLSLDNSTEKKADQ